MGPPLIDTTYNIDVYRITDRTSDHLLARDEVLIKADSGDYRKLSDEEWKKFAVSKTIKAHSFIPVEKNVLLDGAKIVAALEMNPNILPQVVKEMGGVAYVILALENHFNGSNRVDLETSRQKMGRWEKEFQEYYQKVERSPLDVVASTFLPHILFHEGAIETLVSFVPSKDRTKDLQQDVNKAMEAIKNNPAAVRALARIAAVGSFIFGMKRVEYEFEAALSDALNKGKTDCDKYASLYVHLGQMVGLNIKLYTFNNHVTVIYEDQSLPGGRVIIESTNGRVVDSQYYYNLKTEGGQPLIPSLLIGFPLKTFEASPEKVVASVFVQRVNDLMEARRYDEAKRYMKLTEGLRPDDPSILMLFQILLVESGDRAGAEQYRLKLVQLLQKNGSLR